MAQFSFYSNENFDLDMVKILRELRHNVITSYEAGQANQSIPDNEVLNFATHSNLTVLLLIEMILLNYTIMVFSIQEL